MLAAAEPSTPRRLGGLIDRLGALEQLRAARSDRRAIGAAALADLEVRGIAYDSRRASSGSLFVAISGETVSTVSICV